MSSPTTRLPNIPVPAAAAAPATGAAAASAAAVAPAPVRMPTPDLLAAMLRTSAKVSDLFFSPGKPPLVEINGKLASAGAPRPLTREATRPIGRGLIGNTDHAIAT